MIILDKIIKSHILVFISGLLFSTVFAPIFFFPALLNLAVLAYLVKNSLTLRNAIKGSYIWGFGSYLSGLYWISIAPLAYGEDHAILVPLALIGIPAALACYNALIGAIGYHLRNNNKFYLLFSIIWATVEWLRSFLFTGFPWNLLAYSLANHALLCQIINLISVYGLGLIIAYITIGWLTKPNKQEFRIYISLSFLLIIGVVSYGYYSFNKNPISFSNIKVRLVQPSIPQDLKWDEAKMVENLYTHINMSTKPFVIENKQSNPDIIVWSEAALVAPLTHPSIYHIIHDFIDNNNFTLLTGGITLQTHLFYKQLFASMFALEANKTAQSYHKSHLVPFGEYVPFKEYLPLKKLTQGIFDYSPGPAYQRIEIQSLNLRIRPLICYEAIFPAEVGGDTQDYDLIVNITNDAWYRNTSGPYQHLYITAMRAIEYGVPILRAASNGISAIIAPNGIIISKTKLNDRTNLDGLIPHKQSSITLYSLLGNWVLGIFVLFMHYFYILTAKIINKICR